MAKYENWLYTDGAGAGEKSVGQVCKEYLEDIAARRGIKSESYTQNERYIRLYIAPKCAGKRMSKMTLRDWQAVINGAQGENKPLSHKTLENLRGMIMGIIKFGYADYQCELPRGKFYIPEGHSKEEKQILQPSQVKKLMEPSDLWYHSLFCFLCITGMRPGEALGLKLDDIYDDHIVIRRAVNAKGIITEGKNENARRMIPVGSTARAIIEKTVQRNQDYKLHTEWIFCSRDGSQGSQSTMRNQWNELKKERGLSGTVYSLRHTFISLMKNVMPEQMIKDIVGHSVSMTTFETYGHIVDGDRKRAAEVIDLTFEKSLGDIFGDR